MAHTTNTITPERPVLTYTSLRCAVASSVSPAHTGARQSTASLARRPVPRTLRSMLGCPIAQVNSQFLCRLEVRHEGIEIAIVHANEISADVEDTLQLTLIVHLDQDIEAK